MAAVLPARAAENAAAAACAGPDLTKLQKAAYPDVSAVDDRKALEQHLKSRVRCPAGRSMLSDPGAGRIEASQASRWFRFVDGIPIRITADGPGSWIDMRSLGRQGRNDFGVNAARIRAGSLGHRPQVGARIAPRAPRGSQRLRARSSGGSAPGDAGTLAPVSELTHGKQREQGYACQPREGPNAMLGRKADFGRYFD
jgi:uncharacterized protein (DUF1499 family)